MAGNPYFRIPTAQGHILEFDDDGTLSVDDVPVGSGGASNLLLVDVVSAYSDEVASSPPNGDATVDGTAVTDGMRVLLTQQNNSPDDGIWIANTTGDWTRPTDWASGSTQPGGILVVSNDDYGNFMWSSIWQSSRQGPFVVDSDNPGFFMLVSGSALSFNFNEGFPVIPYLRPQVQIGNANVSIFSYFGNPNGNVTPSQAGDLCIDASTPALWQAQTTDESSWTSGGGGGSPTDAGQLLVYAWNPSQSLVYAQNAVLPAPINNGDNGYIGQFPAYASDWLPLNNFNPGDEVQVMLQSGILNGGLPDTVGANGTILVWDGGSNLMEASWTLDEITSVNPDSGNPTAMTLTQVQVIGSDLSINSGNAVYSTAGGSYNVLIKTSVNWD